jgi:hypothetical protein
MGAGNSDELGIRRNAGTLAAFARFISPFLAREISKKWTNADQELLDKQL